MTEPGPVTDQLLAKITAGDNAAWDELVRRYTPLVWSVARSARLSDEEATDVVQTTWIRLFEALPTIRVPMDLAGFLVMIARREAERVVIARRRELPLPVGLQPDQEPSAMERDPVAVAERNERDALVRRAVQQLPMRCQTLLRIMAQGDRSPYDELAAVLAMPIGSIGPTRSRCLARLRQLLSAMARDEMAGGQDLRDVLASEESLVRTLRETPRIMDAVPPEVVEGAVRIRDPD